MPLLRQVSASLSNGGRPTSRFFCEKWELGCARRGSVLTLFVAISLLSGCRIDMHVQPKENPLSRSDFFADQRSERPPVEGTVARGELREDTYFYTGKAGNNPGDYMPFPVTKEVLERGRERYNIYCVPCHSRVGDGNGFIPSRGFARRRTAAPPDHEADIHTPTAPETESAPHRQLVRGARIRSSWPHCRRNLRPSD